VKGVKEEVRDFITPVGYYESNKSPLLCHGNSDVWNLHGPGNI